jgi:hypothetical protein
VRINTGKRNIKSDAIDTQQPDSKQELGSQLGYFENVQNGPKQNDLAAKNALTGMETLKTSTCRQQPPDPVFYQLHPP